MHRLIVAAADLVFNRGLVVQLSVQPGDANRIKVTCDVGIQGSFRTGSTPRGTSARLKELSCAEATCSIYFGKNWGGELMAEI